MWYPNLLPRGCGSPAHDSLPWAYQDSGNQVACAGFMSEILHTYDARATSHESEVRVGHMREWGGGPCAASMSCESDMTERGHGGLAVGFMGGLLTRSIKVHLPGIQG